MRDRQSQDQDRCVARNATLYFHHFDNAMRGARGATLLIMRPLDDVRRRVAYEYSWVVSAKCRADSYKKCDDLFLRAKSSAHSEARSYNLCRATCA